jgi:2-oxoglutarate dehydrogenase E2 component (dihydrolipoamide succinyltransferase)
VTDTTSITSFTLPSLGDGVSGAALSRWLKNPGDTVIEGEPLLEVATDKVDSEVAAPFSGTLFSVIAQEGDTIEVGGELAFIDRTAAVASISAPPPFEIKGTVKANPEDGGPAGGLVAGAVVVPAHAALVPAISPPAAPSVLPAMQPGDRLERLTPIRHLIADRMMQSLQSTAQLTSVVEVDVTAVARIRERYKVEGRKISYLPFFIKAAVDALQKHPVFNTTTTSGGAEVVYHRSINVGIAVDSPKGLMVPVISDAQSKNVDEISAAVEDLADRVRSGRIAVADLDGGTFTLTNTGSRGALFDTPILNCPQTAILGTGAVVQRVVPISAEEVRIGIRSFAYLSLTYDHRIVDGADAARFLSHIKAHIESGAFEHSLVGP